MQMRRLFDAISNGYESTRDGKIDLKVLLEGREDSPDCYKFMLIGSTTEYGVVRHRHNFDQVRLVLKGEFGYGKGRAITPGLVSYFPEGVYYGPQSRAPGTLMALCQFGGASGSGYYSRKKRKVAHEALQKKGRFEKGVYVYVDEKGRQHKQESVEAIAEYIEGGKIKYPRPRYSDVITMDPQNFEWIPDRGTPGIDYKWLGTFNERGTRIGFIQLKAGATLIGGRHNAPELFFITQGAIACQGESFPLYSAFGFEANEDETAMRALEDTELMCLQMPKF